MEENKSIETRPAQPLELKKEMELKVFAIACVKKDLFDREQMAVIKDKLMIIISMAYSDAEAMMGAAVGISGIGFDPNLYVIPSAILSKPVKDIIDMTQAQAEFVVPPLAPAVAEKPKEETKQQSLERMVASVRMIFDHAGTATQRIESEKVIKKFLEANAKTGN